VSTVIFFADRGYINFISVAVVFLKNILLKCGESSEKIYFVKGVWDVTKRCILNF
jgi:hypothetical protein